MNVLRALGLAPILFLVACSGIRADVREESDPYADEDDYTRSVEFGSQDLFDRADRLELERDFEGAIAIYRNLYQTSPDRETRARALLEWARCERSAFNPDRDTDAANARLRLLLETYPNSEVAPEAAGLLEGSN